MKLTTKLLAGAAFALAAMVSTANAADMKIALLVKSLGNGFFEAANRGAEEAAKELGGVEIIDSRYKDFKFTAGDVIADNASSGAFVTTGVTLPPDALDLATEAVLMEVDGEIVDSATGAAVQGHPGEALALAANDLAKRGLAIEPGWIVLTGGITDAVFAPPGSAVGAHFASLGSVFVHGGEAS